MIDGPAPRAPRVVGWLELLASVDFISFLEDGDQVNPERDARRRQRFAEFATSIRFIDPTMVVSELPGTLPSPREVIEMCEAAGFMKRTNP